MNPGHCLDNNLSSNCQSSLVESSESESGGDNRSFRNAKNALPITSEALAIVEALVNSASCSTVNNPQQAILLSQLLSRNSNLPPLPQASVTPNISPHDSKHVQSIQDLPKACLVKSTKSDGNPQLLLYTGRELVSPSINAQSLCVISNSLPTNNAAVTPQKTYVLSSSSNNSPVSQPYISVASMVGSPITSFTSIVAQADHHTNTSYNTKVLLGESNANLTSPLLSPVSPSQFSSGLVSLSLGSPSALSSLPLPSECPGSGGVVSLNSNTTVGVTTSPPASVVGERSPAFGVTSVLPGASSRSQVGGVHVTNLLNICPLLQCFFSYILKAFFVFFSDNLLLCSPNKLHVSSFHDYLLIFQIFNYKNVASRHFSWLILCGFLC